jgi:predicted 2-oxoglutarate/Fe(II)-dependent dioxygenase YbiX
MRLLPFTLLDLLGLRRMAPISRLLRFDEKRFAGRVPPESQFLTSFETDYPVFRKENLIPPETCDRIVANLRAKGPLGLAGMSVPDGSRNKALHDKKSRHTEFLVPDLEDLKTYVSAFESIRREIESFFKVRLGKSDGMQALGYPPGGRYELHADNCAPVHDARGRETGWTCNMPHRVISTVFFLTATVPSPKEINECSGGELTFAFLLDRRNKPFTITPDKGLFVAFPSTPYFAHRVHPVKEGYRVTLVDWYAGKMLQPAG